MSTNEADCKTCGHSFNDHIHEAPKKFCRRLACGCRDYRNAPTAPSDLCGICAAAGRVHCPPEHQQLDLAAIEASLPQWIVSVVMVKQSWATIDTRNKVFELHANSAEEATGKALRQAKNEFPDYSLHTICYMETSTSTAALLAEVQRLRDQLAEKER